MEKLAKVLRAELHDNFKCTVRTCDGYIIVYENDNIITRSLSKVVFAFAETNHLCCYISVSIQGYLRFVLYED